MPWAMLAILGVYGVLSCVFAFVAPPAGVSHFFKIPAIFIFLPERMVVPAGRLFVGFLCIVGTVILCGKFSLAGV